MRLRAILLSILLHGSLAGNAPDELVKARALQKSGSMAAARDTYQRALDQAKTGNDDTAMASALTGLAEVDLALGRYAECIQEGEDASARFATLRNKHEEAQAATTLGIARYYTGELEGALRDFERALRIARETGDPEAAITRLNNIGNVYYTQGRYGEALRNYDLAQQQVSAAAGPWVSSRRQLTIANLAVLYQRVGQYERALQLYSSTDAHNGSLPTPERAQMLSNMGTLYRRLGDPVKALETYREAQSLFHKQALLSGEVSVLNNIGIVQTLDFGQAEKAVRTFTEGLGLAEKSRGKQLEMNCLLYRGEAKLRLHQLGESASDFHRAAVLARELGASEEEWRALYGLARVADGRGDVTASSALLHQAVQAIERLRRNSATGSSSRMGFLIERREVYDLLLEHEARASTAKIEDLFGLMEQSRARDLQDRLGAPIISLGALRQRIPLDTLILEYWLGPHSIVVMRISRARAEFCHRELTDGDLNTLRALPRKLDDPKEADWMDAAHSAAGLLQTGSLQSVRRLVIVPDGELARIPFETLPVDGKLVLDLASVSYLPFASAFHADDAGREVWPPWRRTLVAFADPELGARGNSLNMAAENGTLPQARQEVESLAKALGGRTTLHIGANAQKRFLSEALLAGVPFLHLATHAFADIEDPERSYVLFSPPPQSSGFDYLFLKEAATLHCGSVRMVTVSACDSGSGRFMRGEGLQSFSIAFLSAGAKSAVTSLWRVGDRPAAELMQRFYEFLAAGENAADALREAKLAFRRSGTSAAHPAHWAAFVLNGDGGVRIPWVISWKALLAVPLLVFSLAVLFVLRRPAKTG